MSITVENEKMIPLVPGLDPSMINAVYTPTTGGGTRGRTPKQRKVVGWHLEEGDGSNPSHYTIRFIEHGSNGVEHQCEVRFRSFMQWVQRCQATIQYSTDTDSVSTPLKDIKESLMEPEQVPVPVINASSSVLNTNDDSEFNEAALRVGRSLRGQILQKIGTIVTTKKMASISHEQKPELSQPPQTLRLYPQQSSEQIALQSDRTSHAHLTPIAKTSIIEPETNRSTLITRTDTIKPMSETLIQPPPKIATSNLDNMFDSHEKIAVFIDAANNDSTMKKLYIEGKITGNLDYRKLRYFFTSQCHLHRIHYYAGTQENDERSYTAKLDWLGMNGYDVHNKVGERDQQGNIISKSNVDIEMAIDMYRFVVSSAMRTSVSTIDHVVLFSGDSDFCYPLTFIKDMGAKVTVVSSAHTRSLSWRLKHLADQFIELKDLIHHVNQLEC